MTRKVIILRGPSGSGKSTFIKDRFPYAEICSADHFFYNEDGEYEFDPAKLGEAHAECMKKFVQAVSKKEPDYVVVDNTSTHKWEYENYASIAEALGYAVEVFEFQPMTIAEVVMLAERNKHGVPLEIVFKMAAEFESDPHATRVPIFSEKN